MADPVVSTLATGSSTAATTTASFTSQTAGTLLLLQVQSDDYRTTSGAGRPESTGWALAASGQDFLGHYLWYKIAAGSETSVQYTIGSGSASSYQVLAATNIDPTPLGATSSLHTHGGANTGTTAITPASGSRWLVIASFGGMHSSASSLGPAAAVSNSYTIRSSVTGSGSPTEVGTVAYLVLDGGTATSSATVSPGWTVNSPSCSYGLLAAFKVAAAGGVTGDAASTSTATLTSAGTVGKLTGAARAATAALVAAGLVGVGTGASLPVSATITAAGTVSAAGLSTGSSLPVSATITASGVVGKSTGAAVASTATLTAAGTVGRVTGSTFTTTATLTAGGIVGRATGATVPLAVTFVAAGAVAIGPSQGAAAALTATLASAGRVGTMTAASLSSAATVTAAGIAGRSQGATLATSATIIAVGTVTGAYLPLVAADQTRTVPARNGTRTVEARDGTRTVPARPYVRRVT